MGAVEQSIRRELIKAGVKELKAFGYPDCTAENILTEYVFKKFFLSMLHGTIEECPPGSVIKIAAEGLVKELVEGDGKNAEAVGS